jgi:amino acid transporter
MNQFDLFAQDLQRKLNKTNFKISNFFFILSFIFFFLLIQSTLVKSDLNSGDTYLHVIMIAGLIIFLTRKNRRIEENFLKTNKNPIKIAPAIKILNFIFLIFGLFISFLLIFVSGQLSLLFIPCMFVSIYLGMNFLFSTPVRPKDKNIEDKNI